MTDNTFNLDELQELKQAYQLIDEKLDGKEIVTPEQIKTVTLKNIGFFKETFKRDLTWSTLAFAPLMFLYLLFTSRYTVTSLCVLGIYYAIELTLRFLLMRRMYNADISGLDVKTLLDVEKSYMRSNVAIAFAGYIFWIAYTLLYMNTTMAIVFTVILFLAIVTRTKVFKKGLVRSLSTPVEPKEIGKVRQFFVWFFSIILFLLLIPLVGGNIQNMVANGFELFSFLNKAGYILCYGTLILQGIFLKKIRMGRAPKIAKATTIMAIIGIVLTLIPAIKLYIAGASVAYTDIFPAFLAVLTIYMNSTPKKQ